MIALAMSIGSCSKDDDSVVVSNFTGTLAGDTNVVYATSTLSGLNELPPVITAATGTVSSSYNKTTKILTSKVEYSSGLIPTKIHIHRGEVGLAGPVTFDAVSPSSSFPNPFTYSTVALTPTQETDLLNGLNYFNLHTAVNPGGELRGQLASFAASTATGTITGNLNSTTKILKLNITYSGLTPISWHIHKGAVGVAGDVVLSLGTTFTSPFTYTSIVLTDAQITDLKAGLWYVNIHTSKNSSGEIRGQLVLSY